MNHVVSSVTKIVNFISTRGLNHRQFISLEEAEANHKDLPFHNNVRWHSFGKVVKRVWEEIFLCLEMKEETNAFPEFCDLRWSMDLAFLVDVVDRLNKLTSVGVLTANNTNYFHCLGVRRSQDVFDSVLRNPKDRQTSVQTKATLKN